MFIDYNLVLADAQAITQSGASTSYIDTLAAGDAVTNGAWFIVVIKTAVTSSGSATIVFALQTDDNSSFSSPTTLYATGAIAKATLVAGYSVAKVRIPLGAERYLRGYATVAVADLTAGAWDMKIVKDPSVKIV